MFLGNVVVFHGHSLLHALRPQLRLRAWVRQHARPPALTALQVAVAAYCRSIEQLRLANGLCRLAEVADQFAW